MAVTVPCRERMSIPEAITETIMKRRILIPAHKSVNDVTGTKNTEVIVGGIKCVTSTHLTRNEATKYDSINKKYSKIWLVKQTRNKKQVVRQIMTVQFLNEHTKRIAIK